MSSPYREPSDRYPWLSQRTFLGKELKFMMTNSRSESWYSGNVEANNDSFLKLISTGSRVIDCGANEGLTTIIAAIKAGERGRVLAIEPAPHNWEPICINVALNGLEDRVTMRMAAVGDTCGKVRFTGEQADDAGPEVNAVTLDSLAWFNPDVIKIDIEGYEVRALRGAANLLRENKPVIFLETHLSGEFGVDMRKFGDTPQQLLDLMTGLDYQMFQIGGELITEASRIPNGAIICRPNHPPRAPKHLIYTLAYGEQAWKHALIMVPSLRTFGRFDGEIRVFTDRDGEIPGACVMKAPCPVKHPYMGKAYIGQFINAADYDRVMFLDSDIVAISDINPMLETTGICMPIECVIDDTYQKWYSISSVAKYSAGELGYNAGTLVADGKDWNHLCNRWLATCLDHLEEAIECGMDQPAINHLFRSGEFKINPFPADWVHFLTDSCGPVTPSTKLVHPKNPLKWWVMRCIYSLRECYK